MRPDSLPDTSEPRRPIDALTITPRKDLVLVKRYEKPERYGSLFIPHSFAEDATWSLWEVVRVGSEVANLAGIEVAVDDVLSTRALTSGVPIPYYDIRDNRDLFFLGVGEIQKITKWRDEQ